MRKKVQDKANYDLVSRKHKNLNQLTFIYAQSPMLRTQLSTLA